ncbi:hypothetical protein MOQ72_32285 [Saccharopolyspora sp. K220]|uniref:hypothetical protein n=1 Tax=Saccharopolyspora soli TaxID=2926618 RepID=UPI001F572B3E|nr:hypothetical protein [Saccharopolyspora soli]MCI2422120.1 hypothetical protein [Saccharopolyspora soli]
MAGVWLGGLVRGLLDGGFRPAGVRQTVGTGAGAALAACLGTEVGLDGFAALMAEYAARCCGVRVRSRFAWFPAGVWPPAVRIAAFGHGSNWVTVPSTLGREMAILRQLGCVVEVVTTDPGELGELIEVDRDPTVTPGAVEMAAQLGRNRANSCLIASRPGFAAEPG